MPKMTLDEFVERLQNSVATAQTNIQHGNLGRLERMIELNRQGRMEALTWSFVIDGDGRGGAGTRAVRLPISTLRPYLEAHIAELSLDMEFAVERAPAWRKAPPRRPPRLVIRRSTWLRRRLHHLTIRLLGRQPGKGEVSVDGSLLTSVGAETQLDSASKVL